MRKILLPVVGLAFGLCINHKLEAQVVSSSITTWKGNAKGAYTITHDDFGDNSVSGIQNYADTISYNRGIKLTFGVITSSCESNGLYVKAKSMIQNHKHEVINHSHTHSCAVQNQNCGGTGTNYAWAEPATQKFSEEVDRSTKSIFDNTTITPRYFIFPYDQFNDNVNNYLKTKGYIGSRSGNYRDTDVHTFTPDAGGFFQSALLVFDDVAANSGNQASILNEAIDDIILNKSWGNRELHNVGTTGWGHVDVAEYRKHLTYVKQKAASNDIWVGTVSEVLTYQIQKLNYTPISTYSSVNQNITVTWNTPAFNVAAYLQPLYFKSPITLAVDISKMGLVNGIQQNSQIITDYKVVGNTLYANVYPSNGPLIITKQACGDVCILTNPLNTTLEEGLSLSLFVTASSSGNTTFQWTKNGTAISGATNATCEISTVALADSGNYAVVVSNGTISKTTTTAKVKVTKKFVPYRASYTGTPINLPGRIEVENFDKGSQQVTYYEIDQDGDPASNPYRTDAPSVDITTCTDGTNCRRLGYTTNGEWEEYTVNVTNTGTYAFDVRYATTESTTKYSMNLDGVKLVPAKSVTSSGSWDTWKTQTTSNVSLNAGTHILRFLFESADLDVNYVDVRLLTTTALEDQLLTEGLFVQNNQLTWTSSNESGHARIALYNLFGQQVLAGTVENNKAISLDSLNKGVYIAIVENGTTASKIKIIVE